MIVKVTSKIKIDANKIMERRGLGTSRGAAKVIASEVMRLSEPYVPQQQCTLADCGRIVEASDGVAILYNLPYAHYQYHGVAMAGRAPKHYTGAALRYHGAPNRGKEWDKRMMRDRGREVSKGLAKYVGGKVIK